MLRTAKNKRKAQTLAEFAMILSTVLGALFILMPIIKNAIQNRVGTNFTAGQWTKNDQWTSNSVGQSTDTEDVGSGTFNRGGWQTSNESSNLGW